MQVYYWNVLFLQSPTIYSYFSCWLHWLSLGRTPEKHNEQDTFNTKPIPRCQFTRNHWNRDNIHLHTGYPKKIRLWEFSTILTFRGVWPVKTSLVENMFSTCSQCVYTYLPLSISLKTSKWLFWLKKYWFWYIDLWLILDDYFLLE